jgi:cytochrome c peroxidase
MKGLLLLSASLLLAISCQQKMTPLNSPEAVLARPLTSPQAELGRDIFFDRRLSHPGGQSCATCHQPEHAFAEPLATSRGAIPARVGTRNAPTLMYASLVPVPGLNPASPLVEIEDAGQIGGLFVDGRATAFEDQVLGPFFNPLEMNLAGPAELAPLLRAAPYAERLKSGLKNDSDEAWVKAAASALASFLRDPLFTPYNSRVDAFIAGERQALSPQEEHGFNLFQSSKSKCSVCHSFAGTEDAHPAFTDHSYVNIGLPQPKGQAPDPGNGQVTGQKTDLGRFRVPTLRNIALTGPWMHDGSFAKLEDVISFYNTRDVDRQRWGDTAYPATLSHKELGNLLLSADEEAALVAFLKALTDKPFEGK